MDDTDLRILREADKPRGYAPTSAKMGNRAENLRGLGLLLRKGVVWWTYRTTEAGRAALAERAPASPDVGLVVAPCGHPLSALHVAAEGLRCRDCEAARASAPRTPETVLRAMLTAYEADALEQEIRFSGGQPMRGGLESEIRDIRQHLADVIIHGAGVLCHSTLRSATWADYEARLAGTRPLDAPPMEVQ